MKLGDYIEALLDEHGLTSISVTGDRFSGAMSFTAYAHWMDSDVRCASARADTPEQAIAQTVAVANAKRGIGVMVPVVLEVEDVR